MDPHRHAIPADAVEPRLRLTREGLPKFLDAARVRPSSLAILMSNAVDLALGTSVAEPGSPDIARGLTLAAHAGAAIFALVDSEGDTVEVSLGDEVVELTGVVDESLVNARRWLDAINLAMIVRDYDAMGTVCAVPTERLRASSTKSPEYVYHLVDALREIIAGDRRGATKLLLGALDATDPDRDDVHAPDWTLHLDVPYIETVFYTFGPDREKVGPGLVKGLELHRKYWSQTADRRRDWQGYLSVPLLALASAATERGIDFDVASDYLPRQLVNGEPFTAAEE